MKHIFKRVTCLLMMLVLMAAMVSACGSSSGKTAQNSGAVKILMAFHDEGSSYLQKFVEVVTEETKGSQITFDVVYCEKKVDKQREQIEAADGKYDVIICRLADASTALQMEVAAGDTPIVFINNRPDADYLKANKYIYVASYEQDAGRYQAEYIWNGLGKPSTVNAIILMGQKGHSAVAPRTDAVKYFFWDNGVDLNIVFSDFANWSADESYSKLDIFKKTGQSVDCIFANSDAMALGAIQWLKDNGYDTSKVLVAGLDCSADGAQAIVDGDMYMTVLQDTENQAKAALGASIALAKGSTIGQIEYASADEKYIWVPFIAVDKNNVKQYM